MFVNNGDENPLPVRTAGHSVLSFPMHHLGHQQMTTDTVLGMTKRVIVDRGGSFSPLNVQAAVRCVSDPRSDRSGTAVSERPSATRPTSRPSLNHWCKIPVNEPRSFPLSQPPAFPFPLLPLIFSSSFFVLGQRRSTLSRSHATSLCSNTVLSLFLYIFTDIFLYFFLYIRHNDNSYTHSLTTTATSYHRTPLLCRDFFILGPHTATRHATLHASGMFRM